MTQAELGALENGDVTGFSPRERAALVFADRLTRDSNHIGDDLFAELRRHFNEGEVVELATVAGLFNYFNPVNNALQMEPTK